MKLDENYSSSAAKHSSSIELRSTPQNHQIQRIPKFISGIFVTCPLLLASKYVWLELNEQNHLTTYQICRVWIIMIIIKHKKASCPTDKDVSATQIFSLVYKDLSYRLCIFVWLGNIANLMWMPWFQYVTHKTKIWLYDARNMKYSIIKSKD